MSVDPKNTVNLTCGIVADPEIINDKILKLRVAVDFAGSERDSDNKSGYFDVVYYLNNAGNEGNTKFIRNQIDGGKMSKGSQVQLAGRLVQERWTTDDRKSSKVVVVAESITYAGGGRPKNADGESSSTAAAPLPADF